MGKKLCVKCGKKEVVIKKRGLCSGCYQSMRTNALYDPNSRAEKIRWSREMEFIRNYFDHKNWAHEPALFRMGLIRYSPDFYDGERNVFIEVVGSRQAFHINKDKYVKFKEFFPKISFELRAPCGELIEIDFEGGRVESWPKSVND